MTRAGLSIKDAIQHALAKLNWSFKCLQSHKIFPRREIQIYLISNESGQQRMLQVCILRLNVETEDGILVTSRQKYRCYLASSHQSQPILSQFLINRRCFVFGLGEPNQTSVETSPTGADIRRGKNLKQLFSLN